MSKNDLYNDLSSNDCSLRRKAILSLKEYADNETIERIEKLFNDEDTSVRYFAKKIVKEIKDKLNTTSSSNFKKEIVASPITVEELPALNKSSSSISLPKQQPAKSSAEQINDILAGNDSDLKIKTLEPLFLNPDSSILPVIIENIKLETSEKVISSMVKLIGKLGGEEYLKIIINFLNNKDLRIKANAIEALEFIGTPKIIPFIVPFLNNDDNRIKANAIKALSRFQPTEMLQILSKMVKSEKIWMRDSAIFALGQIKIDESVELLNIALYDNDANISEHALQTLSKFESALAKKYIKAYDAKMNEEASTFEFDEDAVDNIFQNINTTKDNHEEIKKNEKTDNPQNNEPLQNIKATEPELKKDKIKHCPRCKKEYPLQIENCECGYEFTIAKVSDVWDAAKNAATKVVNSITGRSTEEMKKCLRCGNENDFKRKSCSRCGFKFTNAEQPLPEQTIEEKKKCPECGCELNDNVQNCSECGFDISANNVCDTSASGPNITAPSAAKEKIMNFFQRSKDAAQGAAKLVSEKVTQAVTKGKEFYDKPPKAASNAETTAVSNPRVCPECGLEQVIFQESCSECGYVFTARITDDNLEKNIIHDDKSYDTYHKKICPECGFETTEDINSCSECGFKYTETPVQQQVASSSKLIICPECNETIKFGVNTCGNCGFELTAISNVTGKTCPECNQITTNENTCGNCGFEFKNNTLDNAQSSSNISTSNGNEKECPFCAETIKKAAKICKHCHSKLET